jgi:transcriptional/translational regulatory protein YebC/TACO1
MQNGLEELGLEILSSGFEYIPTVQKELTQEQQEDIDKLLEKLEEDDDVNNVYTTIKDSEE